jgi:ABC-type transport system involved in multi-copper enzyme maturation permease subunit
MSSKAITDRPEDHPLPGDDWRAAREVAPSVLREDEPTVARTLGLVAAFLVILGGMALAFNLSGKLVRVSSAWATFILTLGLCGLLFHAAFDRDQQIRRIYMAFAYLALVVGAFLCIVPYPQKAGDQFGPGFLCLTLSLLFQLAFHRNETDPWFRNLCESTLAGGGALMALVGLIGGNVRVPFLVPFGLLLALLGMVYLAAFVSTRGTSDDRAYLTGWGLGAVGLLVFLIALCRSVLPVLFKSVGGDPGYYMPGGLLLMGVGLLYMVLSVGLCSDRTLVVLTRRELGAFFYSPIAYFVMLGFSVISWFSYWFFVERLLPAPGRPPSIEPVVRDYLFGLFPVFAVVFVVPALTMRLLSEEQRSGTLEVLLTAPVDEVTVVLSKFLAAFVMFMVVWVPYGLYLLAIPLAGAAGFDYRPLLSFLIGLSVTGAAFISMGLFFSSLTRNQIASGVMTFAGMLALTFVSLIPWWTDVGGTWEPLLKRVSYLDLWTNTLEGKLIPTGLMYFASLTLVWLFVTVKWMESRRWR